MQRYENRSFKYLRKFERLACPGKIALDITRQLTLERLLMMGIISILYHGDTGHYILGG